MTTRAPAIRRHHHPRFETRIGRHIALLRRSEGQHAEHQRRRRPGGAVNPLWIQAFLLRKSADQFVGKIVGIASAQRNDAATASRAAWQGPSGFSFESISTASLACGRRREAAASIGSDIPRNAAAAEAAADRCRNERREKRAIGNLQEGECIRKFAQVARALGVRRVHVQSVRRKRAARAPNLVLILLPPRVIPRPRLDLIVLLILDLQLAVAAVELGIGRRIADVVLAAQFGRDLVEGFPQLVELVPHVDDASARSAR